MEDSTGECIKQAWKWYLTPSCKYYWSKYGHMAAPDPKEGCNTKFTYMLKWKMKWRFGSSQSQLQLFSTLKQIMNLTEWKTMHTQFNSVTITYNIYKINV